MKIGRVHDAGLLIAAILAAALAAVPAAPAAGQEQVDRREAAAPDGKVRIKNVSGSVQVEGWDRAEIAVTGTLGKGTERLDFTVEGRRAEIQVVLPRHARSVDGSDLTIKAPRGSDVTVETVSADVTAAGIAGALDIHTVSGDVAVRGDPRELSAQSVSGDLQVVSDARVVRLESVSGEVRFEGAGAELTASTISGDVTLRLESCERLRLNSVSGDLDFSGAFAENASVSIESHSGDLLLTLPAKTAADWTVQTFSGDIDNGFGPKAKRTSKYAPGRELDFTTGGGGARLNLTTFSGDVVLRTR